MIKRQLINPLKMWRSSNIWKGSKEKNDIHWDVKKVLNSANACYYSVQKLMSPHHLSQNVKIKIQIYFIRWIIRVLNVVSRPKKTTGVRVFQNKVLRSVFGPNWYETAVGKRNLYNEELHNLSSSRNIFTAIKSKRIRWMRYVTRTGNMRNAYKILAGKPDGKGPLWWL